MPRSTEIQDERPFCEPTGKQQAFLDRHGLQPDREMDYYEASRAIGQYVRERRALSPTARQKQFLTQHGKWRDGMSRGEAHDMIGRIMAGETGPSGDPGHDSKG